MAVYFSNPYKEKPAAPQYVVAATGEPLVGGLKNTKRTADGRTSVSQRESMFSERTGEINASNKKEIMEQVNALLRASELGQIKETSRIDDVKKEEIVTQMRLAEADKTGAEFQRLGEMFGDAIYTYGERQGIARNVLLIKNPKVQEEGKIKVYRKQTTVYMATGPAAVVPSYVELDYIYPAEYDLQCLILCKLRELAFAGPEFLDEKLGDALGSHMVAEDRLLRNMSINSAGIENTPIGFNTLSPATLIQLYRQPQGFGLNVVGAYFANDLWPELMTNNDFVGWWDPATMHEMIMEGKLGKALGCTWYTDGFRDLRLQVLLPGELFFYADPAHLGGLIQREELQAHQIDRFATGEPYRGFYARQSQSMAIGDPRGCSYGFRL